MRALPLFLACLALPALAQDPPPAAPASTALRVSVRIESRVDGSPEPLNGIQYFVVERLINYGLRVDSLLPIGNPKFDDWIAQKSKAWEAKEPGAAPASITIEGVAACDYNDSKFFGQGQAHNYKGKCSFTVKNAAGETLAAFDWEHSWGRLPTNYTKSQVLKEYNQMIAYTVAMALLHLEQLRAGVPEGKRAELAKWEATTRKSVLDPLKENMADCPISKFLKSIAPKEEQAAEEKKGEPAKEAGNKDGGK